jgi:thiamine-phosphate pyrophosphorylase
MKHLRHELAEAAAAIPAADRHAMRDTVADVGTRVSTAAEGHRGNAWDVCAASFKRSEQALRSLEEYGKLLDAEFAGRCEALRYRLYTLEKAVDTGRASRNRLENVRLCVLVDGRSSEDQFAELIAILGVAEVGMIQLRDKILPDNELKKRAHLMCSICRSPQWVCPPGRIPQATLCIVNDRPDISAAVAADGVHLGKEDLSVKDARTILGPRPLIGVSTHNIEQARQAVLDGANYLGAGPTFPSQTKSFDDFAGLDYLREVAAEIRLPTFAIGGIAAGNLPEVLGAGISRVAVGAAVTEASQPGVAARELLVMLENATPALVEGRPSWP